jgi:hypothetical protein
MGGRTKPGTRHIVGRLLPCFMAARYHTILIVGDFLSVQFFVSMLSSLGRPPKESQDTPCGLLKPLQNPCSFLDQCSDDTTVEFDITLWMFRCFPVEDWSEPMNQVATSATGSDQYHKFIQTNPNRTAGIANTCIDEYVEAFDSLLAWLDTFGHEKLLAFSHQTLPGHSNRAPLGNAKARESYDWNDPFELHQSSHRNYAESRYSKGKADQAENTSNWHLFELFNEHSKNLSPNASQINSIFNGSTFSLVRYYDAMDMLALAIAWTTPYLVQPIAGCISIVQCCSKL